MFFQILKIKMDFELDNQHIAYCILSALPFQKIPECIDNAILVQFLSGDEKKKVENSPMNV